METTHLPPAILLMGPTTSGKTAVAMALADRFPVELISVDSAQVFVDMNLGTAKPDPATLARYPHRLIDLITPEQSYSAARFCADALAAMAEITAAGKVPLLVGGTILYFRALLQGLAELPQADPALRAEIDAEAAAHGWPAIHARLASLDPTTAARLHPTDSQRLQRALEICLLSGRPMSALLAESESTKPSESESTKPSESESATESSTAATEPTKTPETKPEEVKVKKITISGSATIEVGQTVSLSASVSPDNAANKSVRWEIVSGKEFVSVDDKGTVKGVKPEKRRSKRSRRTAAT